MPRKLLQGLRLLATLCIGRPKVVDENEQDDLVARIAGRLTSHSSTEERLAPDAGSATVIAIGAADSPAPAEADTGLAALPVAEPDPPQSQHQGPAASQHLITALQALRWKAIDLSNWEADLEVREAALQRHEIGLQRYEAALQRWREAAEEDLRQRGQELCQRGKAVEQGQKKQHAVIRIAANATAAAQPNHPLNAAQQGKQAPTPQRLHPSKRTEVCAPEAGRHLRCGSEPRSESCRGKECSETRRTARRTPLQRDYRRKLLRLRAQRALRVVRRLAKLQPCPNTCFLRRIPGLLLGAAPTLSVCAHARMSAARSSSAGAPASTRSTSSRLQTASEHSAGQAPAMDLLAAAGSAPAAPDLPEGLGWSQCPHGYLEPVTGAESPHSAPESPERWESNSQLDILLELGCPYAHSRCCAPQAGGAHQADTVAALQHSPGGHHAAIHADVTAAAQAHPTRDAAHQTNQAEPARAPVPAPVLAAAEYNPSPGWHPLQPSAWQVPQVKQAGHADAVAGRTGDDGRICRVAPTEVNLLQHLLETATARALHAERQQAEQQHQLVQAKREVSGVRRRCAEKVARALQRAAEQQAFFHTAPHQICQDMLVGDRVLGQGAFGVAQLCYTPVFGWLVAKIIHGDAEPFVPHMYRQEAELLCGLAHPHIVRGYGLIVDAADPRQARGLMMEALDEDLSSLLDPPNRDMLTHKRLMGYAYQAAQALAYCHARGIVHLDVKPDNFLLSGTRGLKLADFGLACRLGPLFARQAPGRGTQGYMAPELTTGRHIPTEKADVWSLGMTFYQLVMLEPPYQGLSSEQVDAALQREEWPAWHECDMPAQWPLLLSMCLQWDPAERASMQQLVAFLERHQR